MTLWISSKQYMQIEQFSEKKLLHPLNIVLNLNILNSFLPISTGNDSLHKPNPWEFLVNRQHHLIWCNVFKAASTSWMYNFNILAGYSPTFLRKTNMVPLTLARRKYPRVTMRELELAMNDSITFLIVRHPFERLLSAYRDKLMFALPHSLHDKLGAKIVRKYRKVVSVSTENTLWACWVTYTLICLYLFIAFEDVADGVRNDDHCSS